MKILWITNIIFPSPCKVLGLSSPNTGGWMYALAADLVNSNRVTLSISTVYEGTTLLCLDIDNIRYYLIPKSIDNVQFDSSLEKYWLQIKKEFSPDVIHIHGTEFAHGLAYIRSFGNKGVVISIQGLISVYAKYYLAGISIKDILRTITIHDIYRQDTLFQQQQKFYQRGEIEMEYIRSVDHIIGRTSWDRDHTHAINPLAQYHFNNETLRPSFYNNTKWEYANCEKHSIFLSQAGYPIKGLHQVLKALYLVLKDYPDTKLYVAGNKLITPNGHQNSIRRSGYANYLMTLIQKLKIAGRIIFLGPLNEHEIYEQYRKANVFICPSSIENSPNSLGEAQLVGTPIIASYVGGIPDMVTHGVTGLLYRFEEVEMLAAQIIQVFENNKTSEFLSLNGIQVAGKRHSQSANFNRTLEIYETIIEDETTKLEIV